MLLNKKKNLIIMTMMTILIIIMKMMINVAKKNFGWGPQVPKSGPASISFNYNRYSLNFYMNMSCFLTYHVLQCFGLTYHVLQKHICFIIHFTGQNIRTGMLSHFGTLTIGLVGLFTTIIHSNQKFSIFWLITFCRDTLQLLLLWWETW